MGIFLKYVEGREEEQRKMLVLVVLRGKAVIVKSNVISQMYPVLNVIPRWMNTNNSYLLILESLNTEHLVEIHAVFLT